jgi:hypothetical protein
MAELSLAACVPRGYHDLSMEADPASKRRGRPPVFPENLYDEAAAPQEPLTRRQRQNRLYARKALDKIDERYGRDERASYFYGTRTPRWGVLAELGRTLGTMEDTEREDDFWQMVMWLLQEQPRVKEAEAELRRMRTGRRLPARTEGLTDALEKAIDSYRNRHPDLSRDQEIASLRALLGAAERAIRTEEDHTRRAGPKRR